MVDLKHSSGLPLQIPSFAFDLSLAPSDPAIRHGWLRRQQFTIISKQWGLPSDSEVVKRLGELLSYRDGRMKSMGLARAAKTAGDVEAMNKHVRAAQSQQRVVLRRLRLLRLQARPPGSDQ